MENTYRPRDPRRKLREVTNNWTLSMRVAGRVPNCGVVFGDEDAPTTGAAAHGWLLGDRRPGTQGDRYLIMDDGDVWRARVNAPDEDRPPAWMTEPDDDYITCLARALGDARLGGAGWLELASGAERVGDRRLEPHPFTGPERRTV